MNVKNDSAGARPRLIQSVDRALSVLTTLVSEPAGLSLFELAGRLELAPQTVQGLVRTLQHHGLVTQTGKGAPYVTGPGLGTLARRWSAAQDRAGGARSAVLKLAGRIGEYVLLTELRGDALFALVEAKSNRELAVAYEHCSVARMHLMATGKVLLACVEEETRERLVPQLDLAPRGSKSITSRSQLESALAKTRRDGYATCRNEGSDGTAAIAVPLRDAGGQIIAALGTSLPLSRFGTKRRKELLTELQKTAAEIQNLWGA
jgi:DNA-binding IclR family transcriptional regulator